jgi:hypothetical protein
MKLCELGETIKLRLLCTAAPVSPTRVERSALVVVNKPVDDNFADHPVARLDPIPKIILTELWQNDKARVRAGLKQLANLCFPTAEPQNRGPATTVVVNCNRRAVYEAGGYAAIVGAMIRWMNSPDIGAEGCRALHNATTMDSNNNNCHSAVYRDSAVKVGALEIVLATMRRFSNDRYVQRVGCGALYSLVKNSCKHATRLVTELDGMKTIVTGMQSFPDSRRLQMWACFVIEDLTQWETTLNEHIVDSGALVVLAAAIGNYREVHSSEIMAIQEKARNAMKRLS